MYVCICNALKDRDVRRVAPSCETPAAVYRALGCETRCGRCVPTVRAIMNDGALATQSQQSPLDGLATQPAAFSLAAE